MDSSLQGAAALAPLLQQAVGDPSLALLGEEEIDRVMRATEIVVGEIVAASHADAARYHSAVMLGAEEVAARRRIQLNGLRHEILDRATDLAVRFEALLDELEAAEAALSRASAPQPAPAQPVAAAPAAVTAPVVPISQGAPAQALTTELSAPDEEKIEAIRMIVSERQPVAPTTEGSEQPLVFGQPHGASQPNVEEGVSKRRWWHRRRGEAA